MKVYLLDEKGHGLKIDTCIEVNSIIDFLKINFHNSLENNLFLIHTSDPFWNTTTISQIDQSLNSDYHDDLFNNLTFFLIKHFEKNRFIFFSGGTTSYKFKNFENISSVKNREIKKGFHWEFLFVNEIEKGLSWLDIQNCRIDQKTMISDFFLKNKISNSSLIIALNILIQGYLAVQAPEYVFGGDRNNLNEANKFIKENNLFSDTLKRKEAEARTSYDSMVRPSDKISDSKQYWFDTLNEEVAKISNDAFKNEYHLSPELKLLHLWKIFRGNWLGKEERVAGFPTNQNEWTNFLLDVYNECKEILSSEKKSLIEEFERRRSSLNHDLVKNKFLLKLGELSEGLNTKEKSAFLYDYFKYLTGRNVDDTVVKARYETVKEALKNWTEIKFRLESFLLKEIDEFEIEPTDDYKKILNDMVFKPDSILKIIDSFVNNIKSLQNFDSHTIHEMLSEFWKNADLLHQTLSMLQMNCLPNKYFKPK